METVEINCRCKDCHYSIKEGKKLYCSYWDYEQGMAPNIVDEMGFCSNGYLDIIVKK